MLIKTFLFIILIQFNFVNAENEIIEFQDNNEETGFIIENTHLNKYQTMTLEDFIINSEKILQKTNPQPIQKLSFLEKLSLQTKNFMSKNFKYFSD